MRHVSLVILVCVLLAGLSSALGDTQPRFVVDEGEESNSVVDFATSRQWQQAPKAEVEPWEAALDYCEGLELGGHDDWFVPTVLELLTLYDDVDDASTYFDGFFDSSFLGTPRDPPYYWTSTSHPSNPRYAYVVSFARLGNDGSLVDVRDKQNQNGAHVICVRVYSETE